jgi:hypothetical protein
MNDEFFAALTEPGMQADAIAAVAAYTRRVMRYIEHIPAVYFLPDAPSGALARLARELAENGEIEMHPDAWIPKCLVDDGIVTLPERP